jgi:dCMP deaminase
MDRTIPSWDEYFINIAKVISTRSKDPRTKVGALLVTEDNRIIGTGYNGFAPGAAENDSLWERPTKYLHVVHAERNAIDFSFNLEDRKNVKLYTTLFPCKHCMAEILKHPITEIYYQADYIDTEESAALAKIKDIQLILLK